MTTLHPVDSTYHRFCHSIGTHSPHCPDGPAAVFARAIAEHSTTVRQSLSSHCWMASCSCGWQWPPCITEDTAREAAAVHYLGPDPIGTDPDGSLLAAIARHRR